MGLIVIGRKKELEILNNVCDLNKSQMVVVHGRRRIGKTYLIDHMFTSHRNDCKFFKFTGSSDQDSDTQREYFLEAIYEWFGVKPTENIEKWSQAFSFLKTIILKSLEDEPNQKIIVFIDEIAWIDRQNKAGFLSALGHFYNTYKERYNNLVMILCGSNASWIKNKILKDSTGPLFHRVDIEIPLYPFDLKETKEYLKTEKLFDIDNKSVVDLYMVLGGVAKYLSYLDAKLSISENINNLFFNLHSVLFNEYEVLFKSLFENKASSHKKIIDTLASKQSGYTMLELENTIDDLKLGTLRNQIEELVDTGFIQPIKRFGYASKNTKFIVIDPFCIFYNKWVRALSKNDLASMIDYFQTKSQEHDYIIWQGFAFENVCMANIHLYLEQRGLKAAVKSISYWNYTSITQDDKGAQIDLLIEYQGSVYDIVECKYYNNEFVIDANYEINLKNKKEKFIIHGLKAKKYDIKTIMLTIYGTKINRYYNSVPVAKDITLDEIIGE